MLTLATTSPAAAAAPETKTITILVRSVYGVQTAYPSCHQSRLFAKLANTKTLTPYALATIKELGYTISIQHDEFRV
jgi:hypothetical protein